MNRLSDTFLTVTDRSLFDPSVPHGMNTLTRWLTKFWLHRTGAQLINSLVHGAPNDYECNVPAITVRPECRQNDGIRRNIVCFCRCCIFLRLMLTKHRLESGKRRTMLRENDVRSSDEC